MEFMDWDGKDLLVLSASSSGRPLRVIKWKGITGSRGEQKETTRSREKFEAGNYYYYCYGWGWVEEGAWLDGFADESILIVVPGNYHFDDPNLY